MAASWLLQVLYTSLLGSGTLQGGNSTGSSFGQTGLLANTTSGIVQGFADVYGNVTVAKFYGVPFAKAPIGSLRFKPPVAPDSWTGVRQATKFGNECLQKDYPEFTLINGDPPTRGEDCLYLNVYTPIGTGSSNQSPLAVMVWIHGGGYTIGSGSSYDAINLALKGVVVVTINYRLDALGFLSTQDDVMPGNYGMLDQVFALQWVQKNIREFGGDPTRVTIFGESAGSSSVSLLTLSPMAKGLFQNAIMESGSSLCPWAFQHPGAKVSPRVSSRLIGSAVGCTDLSDSSKLLSCLQRVDGELLMNKSIEVTNTLESGIIMAPRVETTYGFMPDLPIRLLAKVGDLQVNTLRGYNTDELGGTVAPLLETIDKFDVDAFRKAITYVFEPYAIVDPEDILQKIESIYLRNATDTQSIKSAILEVHDDMSFVGAILVELGMITQTTTSKKHYLYEFNQRSTGFNKFPAWMSAVHGEELAYVFGLDLEAWKAFGYTPTDEERKVSGMMMDLWTNFAKTGVPTSPLFSPAWTPYEPFRREMLKMNSSPRMISVNSANVEHVYKTFLQKIDTTIFNAIVG